MLFILLLGRWRSVLGRQSWACTTSRCGKRRVCSPLRKSMTRFCTPSTARHSKWRPIATSSSIATFRRQRKARRNFQRVRKNCGIRTFWPKPTRDRRRNVREDKATKKTKTTKKIEKSTFTLSGDHLDNIYKSCLVFRNKRATVGSAQLPLWFCRKKGPVPASELLKRAPHFSLLNLQEQKRTSCDLLSIQAI